MISWSSHQLLPSEVSCLVTSELLPQLPGRSTGRHACMCCVRRGFTKALNDTELHAVYQKRTSIAYEEEERCVQCLN